MPSCPHKKHNKLIINHLYISVKILTLIHALMPSLHFQDNFLIAYWLSVIYSLFYKLFQLDTKQSIPKLFPRKKHHKGFVPPRNDGLRCVGKDKKTPPFLMWNFILDAWKFIYIHIRMNIMYVWPAHTSDSPLKDFICILRPFLPYD